MSGILSSEHFWVMTNLLMKSSQWNLCDYHSVVYTWLKYSNPRSNTKKHLSMTSSPIFFLALGLRNSETQRESGWFDDTREWKRHCGHRLAMGTHSGRDHKLWVKQINIQTSWFMTTAWYMNDEYFMNSHQTMWRSQIQRRRQIIRVQHKIISNILSASETCVLTLAITMKQAQLCTREN